MAAGNFREDLKLGNMAENMAEDYFKKNGLEYKDLRAAREWQELDVDYLVDELNAVEVKLNFDEAFAYHPGWFFWVELSVGGDKSKGWWNKTKAVHFMFFSREGDLLIVRNDEKFREFVNGLIAKGDRKINRIDNGPADERRYGEVQAKCMRVYTEQLKDSDIDFKTIKKRRRNK
jgi:hypothetical protein